MTKSIVNCIRDIYSTKDFIPLHVPTFSDKEKSNVIETIDSTFVSSVGALVNNFEGLLEEFTGSKRVVATVNGTASLYTSMYLCGVTYKDLVITQALTFVATCNAIVQLGAEPVFVDISPSTLGLCPIALEAFLVENAYLDNDGRCRHSRTKQAIKAIVPMHTFGHPADLDSLIKICKDWNLDLIEDAAESLGSEYKGIQTGTLGRFGALSFNGNKIITCGGGGAILCKSDEDGKRAKHITTTSKKPHAYEFFHDEVGFNYRMPNLNAALGCAQMESLSKFLANKRKLARYYKDFFADSDYRFVTEPANCRSNYWLNAVVCQDKAARDKFLVETNDANVMTRPVWTLMHMLPMFKSALRGPLDNSEYFESRLVNIPSTPVELK